MPDFFESFKSDWNPSGGEDSFDKHLAIQFPMLCTAISGMPGSKQGTWSTPPMTLMIFAKDGRLRFSLSSRDWPRSFYGQVKDPLHVLECIEEAMGAGDGEWVTKRPDKR